MKRIVCDQLGRKVVAPLEPQRIVSLVPSITEYLMDLKLDSRLIGVTRFCTRPADVLHGRATIGGTKKFDFEKIAGLKPDLVIANKEENYQSGIGELATNYPVWVSDINNLQEALTAMQSIADLVNASEKGQAICEKIGKLFDGFSSSTPRLKVCYFIWRNPWMVCGSHNFIDDMLRRAGFENIFADHTDRYPAVTIQEITARQPDLLFLSSEPFPFGEKHLDEMSQLLPRSTAHIVDAEPFSWYGSRLMYSVAYFARLRKSLVL